MRTKLFIIISILIQFSCSSEKSELERSWVLVESKAKPNSGFIPVLRGQLFHFGKDEFFISYIPIEEELKQKYFIEHNYIKTDTSILGKIIHLSKDSLIIEADTNTYDMHFRPLEEINFSKLEKQKLFEQFISNTYELKEDNLGAKYKYYCSDQKWGERYEKNDLVKFIVYEEHLDDYKGLSSYEWWTVRDFHGKMIFSYSTGGQFGINFFQITGTHRNRIEGLFMNHYSNNWESSDMKYYKRIQDSEIDSMKQRISGDWKIKKLLSPDKEKIKFLKDTFDMSGLSSIKYENRISILDLEKENLVFKFDDDSFKILAGDKTYRKGKKWSITKDGNYLYLDSEISGDNYIEVLDLNDVTMKIRKSQIIGLPRKHESAITYVTLEIELEK